MTSGNNSKGAGKGDLCELHASDKALSVSGDNSMHSWIPHYTLGYACDKWDVSDGVTGRRQQFGDTQRRLAPKYLTNLIACN